MKLSDIMGKIAGLDPAKDYNMNINEVVETPPSPAPEPAPAPSPEPAPAPSPAPVPEVNNNSTVEQANLIKIAAQQKQIEDLTKLNLQLIKQTPIQREEKLSVEDMIYRAIIGKPKEEK